MSSRQKIWSTTRSLLLLFYFLVLTFLVAMKTSSAIWNKSSAGVDLHVFKYIGHIIDMGFMPYKDSFDHKGPLLFLINAAGAHIRLWRGVWLFECAAIFFTAIFAYKTLIISGVSKGLSAFGIFLLFSVLATCIESGNYTEEYSLPFLMVALYIFTAYFRNNIINTPRLFTCGFCFGAVFLLRVNNSALFAVFCIAVLIKSIKEKELPRIAHFLLWFLLGFFAITAPILIWLFVRGAFKDFIDQYFIFNIAYSSDSARANNTNKCKAVIQFLSNKEMLLSLFILGVACYKEHTLYNCTNLLFLLVSVLAISISGQTYGHYRLTLLPCLVPAAALCFKALSCIQKENNTVTHKMLFYTLIFMLLFNSYMPIKQSIDHTLNCYADVKNGKSHIAKYIEDTSLLIRKHCLPQEKITVFGNLDVLYLTTERLSASKFSYQFPIETISPAYMDEYFAEISREKPKIIVLDKARLKNERMNRFIKEHGYTELSRTNDIAVYKR